MRKFNRKNNDIREISIEKNIIENSDGSCLFCIGKTKVICSATFENEVPIWLRNKKSGWITAEYSMLPSSTSTRNKRESKLGKQSGRSIEIQRLIGRSIRTVVDLTQIKGSQFILDCDVLQADGGTRTASVSGAFIAISLAIKKLLIQGVIKKNPIKDSISAISCGILNNEILVDLDYEEDSRADVDANFIFSEKSGISEIQISAEKSSFSQNQVNEMIELSKIATQKIFKAQNKIIG
ncbi:MAG: ribonuclease PH [Rickettsiales bacterium]|nr:ribonuclease PH [Rickettsiales bacterium]